MEEQCATELVIARPDESGARDAQNQPAGAAGGRFPIVGIGASAGGLAAFEAFFSGISAHEHSGMAFVIVQHLAPDHESMLVELVKRYTQMEVLEVVDGMRVLPNCTYVIPPDRDMALLNGCLQLLEATVTLGQRLSIDFFFKSLAQDQRERAICVILSGAGSDGTEGMRLIKAQGGMAMAQNPASTDYDSMPRSAIATGLVDYTLPPAEMPAQIFAYVSRTQGKLPHDYTSSSPKADDVLKKIFVLLRAHTGHDFSQYKLNTVSRRIDRRMAAQQIEHLEDYLSYLRENVGELDALFGDLLIGVTSFFRDPEAFAAAEQQLASLLAERPADSVLRLWVTGCSTGEEAYSLAILLSEQMDTVKRNLKFQVFASDIDSRAIDVARTGLYPASIAIDVSPERLARFFVREDGAYRIHKNIRELLVFSAHDLIKDPPFSKLDLVSCRNLLIYMGPELQQKLIPLFHYALNANGLLFLGSSETVGDALGLFEPVDRKAKLYRRKGDAKNSRRPTVGIAPRSSSGAPAARRAPNNGELPLRELTERTLLARAPVGALVNEQGELLYLHGHTGKYLEPAPGEAGLSILNMAREGLRQPLNSALHTAALQNKMVSHAKLRVKTDLDSTTVNLIVQPVFAGSSSAEQANLFLVSFEEAQVVGAEAAWDGDDAGADHPTEVATSDMGRRLAELSHELRTKDAYLQSTQEQMQTANEELRSSNEELQSTNEELQSTNEELETSKEELQSLNEELATVNSELQIKVSDLSQVNNDMNNLLAGTGVGTIVVDHQLRIQRFTAAVTPLINLIRTDVGRPLAHIVSNLIGYDRLIFDIQDVLDTLNHKEVEVKTRADIWYLLRIRPYRTLENVIEGAVITFMDVSEQKRAQAAMLEDESLRRMSAVMRDASDAITVQGLDGQILAWNRGATALYGWSEAEALTMNIRHLIPEAHRGAAAAVLQRLMQAEVLEPYRMRRLTRDGRVIEVSLTATALVNESGDAYAVFTTERESKDSLA